jgi:hypothetical protein
VNTLGSGFAHPFGVAVDSAGNVYVADFGNNAVKKIVAVGGLTSSASTVNTLGSGFASPKGVAVDGAGNVYVADLGNSAVKKIPLATTPSLSFTTTSVGSTSADSPQTLLLQNVGNAPLLFPVPGTGTNPSLSTNFLLDSGSTCPQVTSSDTTAGTLAPGTCTDLIRFLPTVAGSIGGSLVLTDNQPNSVTSIALSGNATLGTPTLTFAVSNRTFGDVPFTVTAASNSAGAFTYTVVSGPATISSSTVTLTGAGTVTIRASQVANGNYAAATATTSFTVAVKAPTLSFDAIAAQTYGNAPFVVSAASASSGAITYTVVSGPATLAGSTVTLTGAGAVTIRASQVANGNYAAATATTNFTVAAEVPVLNFSAIANQTYGAAPFLVSATSASSGTVTYSVTSGPASISGNTVTLTGVGTVLLRASQAANGNYAAAAATTSFPVKPNTPTLSWNAPSPITYGTALSATLLDAHANVAGTFSYAPAFGTVLKAGKQTLSVTFTPTDTTDYTVATMTVALTVNQATPTVSWAAPGAITYGTALIAAQLNATTSVPGSFTYSPALGTVLKAGLQTLSVIFTPSDTNDYAVATARTNLTVNQATPVITWSTPTAITYGTMLSATQLNATASAPGTFAYTPAVGTTPAVGSDQLSVIFTPTDGTDYTKATAAVTLVVNNPSNPTPVFGSMSPAYTIAGGKAFTLTANGSRFIHGSTVYWGTTALNTQFVSATQLTAQVTAAEIANAGTTTITVHSPAPGGGTSNSVQFEVDTSSGTITSPIFGSLTQAITAGSPASYPVTLPSTVKSVTVTCLNLPSGATCSYSATTNTVTITTTSASPKGTYQVTVVFSETVSGAASGLILLPFLLLPLVFLRKKLAARGAWSTACLGFVLLTGVAATCVACGGGASSTPTSQTHPVVSSGTVSLTIQ